MVVGLQSDGHLQQMFVLPLLLFAASAPTASQQRPALPMSASPSPASVPTIRSADSGLGSSVSRISMDSFGPVPSVPTPSAVDSIPPLSVGPADLASPAPQQPSEVAVKQEVDENLTDSKPSVEMSRRPSITSPTAGNDLSTPTQPVAAGGVGEGVGPGPGALPMKSPTTQLPPQPPVKTPTSAAPAKVVPNPNLKKGECECTCMYLCAQMPLMQSLDGVS